MNGVLKKDFHLARKNIRIVNEDMKRSGAFIRIAKIFDLNTKDPKCLLEVHDMNGEIGDRIVFTFEELYHASEYFVNWAVGQCNFADKQFYEKEQKQQREITQMVYEAMDKVMGGALGAIFNSLGGYLPY